MPNAMIFEELGITCLPTVDGHDITALRNTIKDALEYDGPVLVHAITQKGAGYKPATKDPELFHGIGAYNIQTGYPISEKPYSFTNAFSEQLLTMASRDKKIVAMTAAMSGGTGLKKFAEKYPDRFVDVGIAEEHLLGCAAGLAKAGYKPFVAIYSAFLQRAVDQMVTNVALEKLNVNICIDRAGLVGADGATHHGIFDMAYTKMIPGFTVLAPSCAHELKCALKTAASVDGPFVIRYPKGSAKDITDTGKVLQGQTKKEIVKLKIGKSRTLKKGNDIAILAFGDSVIDALEAYQMLKDRGIKCRVLDMRFVKPLDCEAIADAALCTHRILTVENGILSGGAGESVLTELSRMNLCDGLKFRALGIDDKFISHGEVDKLKTAANIDYKSIFDAAVSLLK